MNSVKQLRLFVGNLPWTVGKQQLKDYFSKFGGVRNSNVMFNRRTGMSRGFGFVQFASKDGYNAAISQESHSLDNTNLIVASETSRRLRLQDMEAETD
ncbi:stem-loop-interacting RNA-binding, mitochondrial-like [Octopus vulgaris]|uniref:Stem-loop-interacting RNA-binding, mitochondrial-like n=1 Tax=Octopus vulgaris TaxID=6645 RepID=A0AA36FKG4_OCTVU|nr:stem-loop-interacting RNA-binding, mitochondrial-like [Octopus vulgaris]